MRVAYCLIFFRAYETSLLVDQEISSEIPYNGKFICIFLVFVTKRKNELKGSYLYDEKFRYEFPEISIDECNTPIFLHLNIAFNFDTNHTFYMYVSNRLLGVFRPRLLAVPRHRGQNRESEHQTGTCKLSSRGLNARMRINLQRPIEYPITLP